MIKTGLDLSDCVREVVDFFIKHAKLKPFLAKQSK